MRIGIAHTAQLKATTRELARKLLYEVFDDTFGDGMTETDWDHCLGGIHTLAWEGEELVGHAALVQRQLIVDGTVRRTGYVEGVVVRESHRRRGIAGELMGPLEAMIERAYDLGALGSSDEGVPLYASRGWRPWEGPLSALTPDGIVATPEEHGSIYVFGSDLDRSGTLTCDWRIGEVW